MTGRLLPLLSLAAMSDRTPKRALALGVLLVQTLAVGHGALVAHTSARDGVLAAVASQVAEHADFGLHPTAHVHASEPAPVQGAEERCALDHLLRTGGRLVSAPPAWRIPRPAASVAAPPDAPRASNRPLLRVAPKASPPRAA